MTNQGKKKLKAEQLNRAFALRLMLNRQIVNDQLHVRGSIVAIENWLRREYDLGRACERRELRRVKGKR